VLVRRGIIKPRLGSAAETTAGYPVECCSSALTGGPDDPAIGLLSIQPTPKRLEQVVMPTLRKTLWTANHLRCRY
jgi:hypothetical protein